jgi:NitT/TauT family transport system substrate-binding protein
MDAMPGQLGALKKLAMAAALAAVALAPGRSQAAETLKFVEGAPPTITMVDLYVAETAGFLKQEGLTVPPDFAQNGAVATQLVASNQSDIGDVSMEPYLSAFEKGMRGKFIGSRGNLNIYFLAIPADSEIETMKDLEGKKIGVLSMASQAIPYIRSMARSAGLNPDADMFLPVGFGDSAVAALKSGQVRALALNRIAYSGLVRAGLRFRYIFHPEIADAGNYGYFASDATIASKRSQLVGFLRAMIKSDIFIRESPKAALFIFWKKQPAARPAGSEEEAVKLGTAELAFNPASAELLRPERISAPDKTALQKLIAAMRKEGLINSKLTIADLVDDSLFQEAQAGVDAEAVKKMARDWR